MIKINYENLYFSEPLLTAGAVNRFLVKLTIYCFYAILAVSAAIFLLSDISRLFWTGVLFLLFLVDRLLHFGQAERSLLDLNGGAERKINIADYLTPAGFKAMEKSFDENVFIGGNFYLYLMKFLVENRDVNEALLRMDVDVDRLTEKTENFLKNQPLPRSKTRNDLIGQAEILLKKAFELAMVSGEKYIEPRHIFSALSFIEDQEIKRLLNLFSVDPADLENAIVFGRFRRDFFRFNRLRLPGVLGGFAPGHNKIRHRIMNRAWTSRPTPTLDKFSVDFTDLARSKKIGFLIGHNSEYERTVDVLSKPGVRNIILVGEPGSGKETVVAHLAYEIAKDKAPAPLFDKRVVSLRIGDLISGASPDEVSKRINKIMSEILAAGNIVLYIPDIHNLTKTSGNHYLNAADIMIPIITTDAFPVIGATYPREFKEMVETRSDFADAFEIVRVEEISEDEAVKLLTYESIILESDYGVIVSFNAVKIAVVLAHKYFRQKLLPASAEELLKESLADASQKNKKILKSDDVIDIAERKTNVPIHRAGKKEVETLLNLENIIHQRLVDQEEAVKAVSQSLREYRSGLSRQGGPIASFLFVGPTGVGKTELSKILAKIQFG
ncbi:ATP-dependent Clp protease ATP-binding subunit, partial [Candidatus Wolfebacteria bacterium]|nr:ATP-dependent Clp protease ATP-binding subunit [Candidatus Wolfebacteria bacterium]